MANFYEVQLALHSTSGLTKDDVINTSRWYWKGAGNASSGDFDTLKGDLRSFYATVFGSGPYLGATMTGTGAMKAYQVSDPKPRRPVYSATSLGSTITVGSSSLPREVAVCVSWKADYISGTPNAQMRGRWYLGCWSSGIVQNDGTLSSTIVSQIVSAASTLLTTASGHNWDLYIYSSKASNNKVTGGWVDNAFDTQRRRGEPATSRTTF